MSIYVTVLDFDDDDPKGLGPIYYLASGVMPSDGDWRHGSFGLAAIPGTISREGPKHDREGEDWPYHPWLRVSVNDQVVVLDLAQVRQLHERLGWWLDHTRAEP